MVEKAAEYESVGLSAITYANGEAVAEHCHAKAQLIYAVSGIMEITAGKKQWRVPPQRAIWMPARMSHSMLAHGAVELRTVYLPQSVVHARGAERPIMIAVSALLRELILRGIALDRSQQRAALRAQIHSLAVDELDLLLAESAQAPERSLPLPSGTDKRMTRICNAIMADPAHPYGIDEWAHEVGASKRTLARRFLSEFGMSFVNWRQQVRMVSALSRLDQGDPVTVIAGDLGYETPAAFSLMFRKLTGVTPSRYASVTGAHAHEGKVEDADAGELAKLDRSANKDGLRGLAAV
jgi:AraC-like DNA-binding protein/quercetin dioxygenase-like cupin family protein